MTRLTLVRHGETLWNLDYRSQGHGDSELTEWGIRQAELTAEYLTRWKFSAIYSSDLRRAQRTATIIGERLGLEPQIDPRLREKNLGLMEGLTMAEFAERFPQEQRVFLACGPDDPVPGGESTRNRFNENTAALSDIAARHPDERVIVVVHGGVLDNCFRWVSGLPLGTPRYFSIFNASISVIAQQGENWKIESWGYTDHLGKGLPLDGKTKF